MTPTKFELNKMFNPDVLLPRQQVSGSRYPVIYQELSGPIITLLDTAALENLRIQNDSTAPYDRVVINVDYVNVGGYAIASAEITLDIATVGINGLDTGSRAANTWYSIWVLFNRSTGASGGIFSTSATTPVKPPGFTKKRRVGWIKTDASANLIQLFQADDSIVVDGDGLIGSTSSISWVAFDGAPFVPPTSRTLKVALRMTSTGTNDVYSEYCEATNWEETLALWNTQEWEQAWGHFCIPLSSARTFLGRVSLTSGTLYAYARGWIDKLR